MEHSTELIRTEDQEKSEDMPAPRTFGRKVVLDEDTYVSSLNKVLEREFFPNLDILRTQHEWILATERGDIGRLKELKAHLQEKLHEDKEKSRGDPTKMTLGAFLSKYMSEDDASFSEIMKLEEKKKRESRKWLYEAEEEHQQRLISASTGTSAGLLFSNFKTKNALMYYPEGTSSQNETFVDKGAPKPGISIDNVRLRSLKKPEGRQADSGKEALYAMLPPSTPLPVLGKRKEHPGGNYNLDAMLEGKPAQPGPQPTPDVGGFSFLGTPVIRPEEMSPLMTWGSIASTPLLIDGGITPKPGDDGSRSFQLPKTPRREVLAHNLVSSLEKKKRMNAAAAASNTVKSLLRSRGDTGLGSLAGLSPAARRLATRLSTRASSNSQLRASYATPSPIARTSSTPSTRYSANTPVSSAAPPSAHRRSMPSVSMAGGAQPGPSPSASTTAAAGTARAAARSSAPGPRLDGLTDNLLNIPE